jgi:predicted dehydrogenase
LPFSASNFGVQSVQTLLPQCPVRIEPGVQFRERLGPQPVNPPLSLVLDLDQAGLSQHAQVPRDPGTGNGQQRRKLSDRCRSMSQCLHDSSPAPIGQSRQHCIHAINVPDLLRNRLGTYVACFTIGNPIVYVCESVFDYPSDGGRHGDKVNLSAAPSGASTSPARLILVGVRGFGRVHAERIARLSDQGLVELVAAVDPAVVAETSTIYGTDLYADLAEALSAVGPVHVVIIAAPLGEHFRLAKIALAAGADVYLEKPPVASLDDFTALLDAEQRSAQVVQVGFQSLGSQALSMFDHDDFGIGPAVRVSAVGAWSRTVGYWTRSPWAGRRSLGGRPVVDGVVTNALAHAVVTALTIIDCRRLDDVKSVETDLYRANAIESDDTSVVRIRTTSGLEVTCALSLCAPVEREPLIYVEGKDGRATFSYTADRVEVEAAGQRRTEITGRVDLLENLLAHRREGAPLLVPLINTGAFMRVLAAVAGNEPIRIDPRAIQWVGEDQDRRAVVDDVDNWLEQAAATGQTFAELKVPWAHQDRDTVS